MRAFSSIPFFRIMLPFAAGILFALNLSGSLSGISARFFISVLTLLLVAAVFCQRSDRKRATLMLADIFMFVFALSLVSFKRANLNDQCKVVNVNKDQPVLCIAEIDDIPVEREKTVKCRLRIREVKTKGYGNTDLYLVGYFRKPSSISTSDAGRFLLIKSYWKEIAPPSNPFEFDYKNYMANKQIRYTSFIDTGAFRYLAPKGETRSLWKVGLGVKAWMLTRLKNSALSQEAFSICTALLTGFDDDIDSTTLQAFSHSGTLHVLSVSGLHVGVIYLVLNFLFGLVDRKNKFKLLKLIFTVGVLWFFALVTGFSAPVLRAVIMFTLFGIGKVFFRHSTANQANILLASAFLLLAYDPFLMRDVGFLLSYFALFGLIYFQPAFAQAWKPRSFFANYLWQSITASFAATLSTLPITLFYFKQFPIWFFVCNLVVVPVSFIALALSVFVLFKLNIFAFAINYLIAFLTQFIGLFNREGFGYLDGIDFRSADVLFLTLTIICLTYAVSHRSYTHSVVSLIIVIVWQLVSLFQSYRSKQESWLAVYNLRNKSALVLKNKSQVQAIVPDESAFNYAVKPHLFSFGCNKIENIRFNYFNSDKVGFLIVSKKGSWPRADRNKITHLLLTDNVEITEKDLQSLPHLKMLITNGSNNNYSIQKAEQLSCKFGVPFYNTRERGAFLLALR